MEFYSSISKLYRHIFPFNKAHLAFTQSFLDTRKPVDLLDVGCGVGDLSRAFANQNWKVEAIDYDLEMVRLAKIYNQGAEHKPSFHQMDMRQIEKHFAVDTFDVLSCFGNTLVHLQNDEEIKMFLQGAREVLKDKALLLIQILNYDYILDKQIDTLPLIDNDVLRFERSYKHYDDSKIDFVTKLTDKEENVSIDNCIQLYPIRMQKLNSLLQEVGFREVEFYSNFKKEPAGGKHIPLVVKARKTK
jgi:SAM-dependent methyltransferase